MESNSLALFVAGSVLPSFVLALLATYVVRRNAPGWGLIDLPSERKVHTTPTPRGGGLAIWFGVVGTFAAAHLLLWHVTSNSAALARVPQFAQAHLSGIWAQSFKLWFLLAAGTSLMLLGLADDRRGLSWQYR